jgi:hypothetical protein
VLSARGSMTTIIVAGQRISELSEALEFVKAVVCKRPFPLHCVICCQGNAGIGFDFCYLAHVLKDKAVKS